MEQQQNDVIGMVSPDTGAHETSLKSENNPEVDLPVAVYLSEDETQPSLPPVPTILFRFKPTLAQRGKIALGEDLFLMMLLPNGRAPLPVELQVGAGSFQVKSAVVGVDGESLAVQGEQRSQLWTPDQEK